MGIIVFGSGGARQVPEGFSRERARGQMLDLLRRIAPMAQSHDVTIVLEALNTKECNFINSLNEGASLVAEVDHPGLRLLVDIYHMLMENEPAAEIVKHGRWIHHAHVAELQGRFAPGTSGEDLGPYLRALREINYRGMISYECNWQDFAKEAAASVKYFRGQLAAVGLE
jgi:sugar phosphate isomerase/epimerase